MAFAILVVQLTKEEGKKTSWDFGDRRTETWTVKDGDGNWESMVLFCLY